MKPIRSKSLQNYWQEIVFILSIGLVLFEVARFNLTQKSMDNWDLALVSLILPLLVGLVFQLYSYNRNLSKLLSIFLTTGSIVMVTMAINFIATTNSPFPEAFSMLIFGVFLCNAGVTMTRKNRIAFVNKE